MLTRTKTNLNDKYISLGTLLEDTDVGFNSEISGFRLLPYENRF